jgi:hypothetical protein
MAIPKPDPKDWLRASATELRLGDRETLRLLQESYKAVQKTLEGLPDGEGAAFGKLIQRAQMERVRRELLAEQAKLFDRLGDKVSARRLRSATRAAKLSRVADRALLTLAGAGDEGKRLYDGATITAQRTIDTMLTRMGISKLPLAERIYNTAAWMNGRLDTLINAELAKGLNAARFAKVARDWFNPTVKGGTRYAAMRLARTEINNAFHATSVTYAQDKPWVSQMNWNLSDSHPIPDKCNEYADLSPWDVYAVPRKPHPQCLCNVTEVQMGEDEWIDKFLDGDFDEYLDAELDKADEQLGIKTETQKAKKVATAAPGPIRSETVSAIGTLPRTQADALQRFFDGMTRDEWSAAGANSNAQDQLIKKKIIERDGKKTVMLLGEPVEQPTYRRTDGVKATSSAESANSQLTSFIESIVTVPEDKGRAIVVAELENQGTYVPDALKRLQDVSRMSVAEDKAFKAKHGKDALGGYVSEQRAIRISNGVFSSKYKREFERDVKSGFFSHCTHGHEHDAEHSFLAHEFGHHVEEVIRLGGDRAVKPIFQAAAAALGIKPPLLMDKTSINRWVSKNQKLIAKEISGYGSETGGEMLAEVWNEYTKSDNPRPAIKAIGDAMKAAVPPAR